jgi:hypothetical protein
MTLGPHVLEAGGHKSTSFVLSLFINVLTTSCKPHGAAALGIKFNMKFGEDAIIQTIADVL